MVELEKQNLKMNTSIYKRELKILKKELIRNGNNLREDYKKY